MATSALNPGRGLETISDNSPYTTSSDEELFADINWPEDLADSPSDDGQFHSAGSTDPENDSPKDETNHSPFYNGGAGDDSPQPLELTNAPSKASSGCRFSKEARSILRIWFNEHKDNPYPTAEEKNQLAARTGLKRSQISLWLVNTRRRYRSRKQHDGRPSAVLHTMLPPYLKPSTSSSFQATPVPAGYGLERPFEELNPLDRWKITPMEQEPAAPPIIIGTVAAAPPLSFDPFGVRGRRSASQFESDLQSDTCLSYLDQSLASYDTGLTSMVSGTTLSDGTNLSYGMTTSSYAGHVPRDRRRRRGNANKLPKPASRDRPFQCTFCPDCTFATKHDWQRHEKSQHLTLESWTCCLSGGTIDTENGPACAFCELLNPDTQHMETHNFSVCQDKDMTERTFYRKDHFQQHLRLTHEAKFHSSMNSWKAEIHMVKSRCGFCSATFSTWSARADHLASHFKCHATMKDWVGDWGLEPHIAALVERAPSSSALLYTQLPSSSMPPPPHPHNKSGYNGARGYLQTLDEHIFAIDTLGDIHDMASGSGPPAINAGFLDLDNVEVADWVDFGI